MAGPIERFAHAMEQLAEFQLPLIHPAARAAVVSRSDGKTTPQADIPLGLATAAIEALAEGEPPVWR